MAGQSPVVGDRTAEPVVRLALIQNRAVQSRGRQAGVHGLVCIGGGVGDAGDDALGLSLRDGRCLLALRHDHGFGGGGRRAAGQLRPGVRRTSCEQQRRDRDGGNDRERPLAGGDRSAGGGARADDALVSALDREVDRLGDRKRQTLPAWTARTPRVTDAEDVEEHADRHQDAAHDDERAGPRGRALDGPGHADASGCGTRAVGGDEDAHLLGQLQGCDEQVFLLELVEPQVRADGAACARTAGVGACRLGGLRCRRGIRLAGGLVAGLLLRDSGGHGIRRDLARRGEGHLVVVRVREPGLHVGRAPVGGEDLALALRAQGLRAGEHVQHGTVDEQVGRLLGDRDLRRLGGRALEDGALRDAGTDHHGGEDQRRHGPHETHEIHLSSARGGWLQTVDSTFQTSETHLNVAREVPIPAVGSACAYPDVTASDPRRDSQEAP